ncbi:sodium:calcium antiporter [Croceicoccus ponticola]|uniref:Sodium:calcium antiporter n=1 Tax=Croceicoccus ponticola TaxID=2217664 RepID=A0A437H220_9SPHN|nr:sodium:calcium antiporter [Croceicoccus ponticola]RVQ69616.1 sodium:calcium antiporter [Croceicoccus ponticola]
MDGDISLTGAIAAFLLAAAAVWWAGSRLPRHVVILSEKTGLGQGLAGMLVLGGITSLPELATATSAAAMGAPLLALNNILGSASFNILLLALADMALGSRPLTSVIAHPVTLIQGVLGMLLLATVAMAIVVGGAGVHGPVGLWSTGILILCIVSLGISNRSERRPMWIVLNPPDLGIMADDGPKDVGWTPLLLALGGLAAVVLTGGVVLASAADRIASGSGLGVGVVGLTFAAAATSLPELSAIVGAVRHKRYELAVGEVFGSNLFNLSIIFIIDLVARGDPVLARAGTFEAVAALLALAMSGIFVLGLIERRDRTFLWMGEDSIAAIALYIVGTVYLITLRLP